MNKNNYILLTLKGIILEIKSNENTSTTLEKYKYIKEAYRMPIVLICDNDNLDRVMKITNFECDDYLSKPVKPLMLKEIIYNLTKNY